MSIRNQVKRKKESNILKLINLLRRNNKNREKIGYFLIVMHVYCSNHAEQNKSYKKGLITKRASSNKISGSIFNIKIQHNN